MSLQFKNMAEKIISSSVGKQIGMTNDIVHQICNDICNQETKNRFRGVFPVDKIPFHFFSNVPYFNIIVNLAEIKKKELNGHFVTIICTPNASLYIDPFGLAISSSKIKNFLAQCKRPVYYNIKTIQNITSPYCGMYAILFCVFFNKDDRKTRIRFSTTQYEINDKLCVKYLRRLIHEIHHS